ncbi:MAG: arylsulfatase [Chloroflexota bacterium]|nr:arylsulfatase [Chloroflexota bacterium]
MPVRPNVIFIITDDQGYGDIACHGNPILKTPNLDQMARQSVQLDDHHHDPLCSPSRAALLTGQYASRNGVWHVIQGRHLLDPRAITMADVFSANGYRTGMFGKWHLGDNYPFAPQFRGFDQTLCHRGGGIGELPDYWGNNYIDDCYYRDGEPVRFQGYCSDVFFDQAIRFMEADPGPPFFVYLATNAMHAPHIVPEQYAAPYRNLAIPEDRANFYGMIANFDENMGKLFRRLRELQLDENTMVIFTADHGTAAGFDPATGEGYNAGLRGKKGAMYDGGHRVNCFFRWQGELPAGKVVDSLTAHVDILPTLIELCGLELDGAIAFDGRSLAPQMRGETEQLPERTLFIHLQPDQPEKWRDCVVMRGPWRLINGTELYHLDSDKGQQRDISSEHPHVVRELRGEYETWWYSLQMPFSEYVHIPIDAARENPVLLSARDWHPTAGRVPWRQDWIADPDCDANGFWMIDLREAGQYELELRAYPREADLPAGATNARLLVGGAEYASACPESAAGVKFAVELEAGKTRLQTWLSNHKEGRARGAYYVYVTRL